jgi:hypothetical protein
MLAIVRTKIEALAKDGDWLFGVATPIEWIEIDGLSEDAVVIRVSFKGPHRYANANCAGR